MKTLTTFLLAGVIGLAASRTARAQDPSAAPRLPRIAATGSLGWYSARETVDGIYPAWYRSSLNRSVGAGFHWTDHLVTTIEAGWTGEGELYGQHPRASFQNGTYGFARYRYRARQMAVGQRYQFGRNAWLHPDIGAGAVLEWAERTGELSELSGGFGRLLEPSRALPARIERRVTPFVSTGLKAYVSERAFVRSDLRVGLDRHTPHAVVNIGFGVDF